MGSRIRTHTSSRAIRFSSNWSDVDCFQQHQEYDLVPSMTTTFQLPMKNLGKKLHVRNAQQRKFLWKRKISRRKWQSCSNTTQPLCRLPSALWYLRIHLSLERHSTQKVYADVALKWSTFFLKKIHLKAFLKRRSMLIQSTARLFWLQRRRTVVPLRQPSRHHN